MKKILANGYIYRTEQGISIENRNRLVIRTNYKNVTKTFLEKVKNKLIEDGYTSDWLSINQYGTLGEYYSSSWDQISYSYKDNSGGGFIPIGEIVEITILK